MALAVLALGGQGAAAQSISEGLQLHFPMDEKEGASVANKLDAQVRGTLMGGSFAEGRLMGAVQLDGKRAHISFPAREFGEVWSLSMWIKPTRTGANMTLASNRAAGEGANGFSIVLKSNGAIQFGTGNGLDKTSFSTDSSLVSFDQWNHVAVSVDARRRTATVYVDGRVVVVDGQILPNFMTQAPWCLGMSTDVLEPYAGLIDELRIYEMPLPGLVIKSLSIAGEKTDAEGGGAGSTMPMPTKPSDVNFARDIAPVLASKCVSCHGPEKQKGGLRLDSRSYMFKGGDQGTSVVPGHPEKSLLYQLVALPADDPDRMPAKGDPLTPAEAAAFKFWIMGRAIWPSGMTLDSATRIRPGVSRPGATPEEEAKDTIEVFGLVSFIEPDNKVSRRIDELAELGYKQRKVKANPVVNDEMFLRRLYLDVAGRIPSYQEAKEFLDSDDPDKRSKLVDKLLDSPAYVSNLYNFWANDMLRIAPDQWDPTARYPAWVTEQVEKNTPYDKVVYDLITATGSPGENGAVGFYFRDRDTPLVTTSMIAQVFMGTQIGCAQCHDHKFDHWKQRQFYELAAFVGSVNPGRNGKLIDEIKAVAEKRKLGYEIDDNDPLYRTLYELNEPKNKKLRFPADYAYDDVKPGQVVDPQVIFPKPGLRPAAKRGGSGADESMSASEQREAYARWVTSPENPMFAKVMANRLWAKLMGLGLVNPIDDWKDSTQPVNAMLLKHLSDEFVRSKFDIKAYLAAVLKSRTYQLHALGEQELDVNNYIAQGSVLRRMSAEQVWDSWLTLVVEDPDARQRGVSSLQQFLREYQEGPRTAERAVDLLVKYRKGEYGKMMGGNMMGNRGGDGKLVRASEMIYPDNFGSFLNIFGQSTREAVSSDSKEPDLQQVLYLLNGDMSYKVLGRDSVLRRNLDESKSVIQQINVLYLSILSRYPSGREMEVSRREIENNGFDGVANVARALLNGREFLFIQ